MGSLECANLWPPINAQICGFPGMHSGLVDWSTWWDSNCRWSAHLGFLHHATSFSSHASMPRVWGMRVPPPSWVSWLLWAGVNFIGIAAGPKHVQVCHTSGARRWETCLHQRHGYSVHSGLSQNWQAHSSPCWSTHPSNPASRCREPWTSCPNALTSVRPPSSWPARPYPS